MRPAEVPISVSLAMKGSFTSSVSACRPAAALICRNLTYMTHPLSHLLQTMSEATYC